MKQKSAIVTGASRGIGKAIALKFARQGYHVAISCLHNASQLEEVRREIESFSVSCMTFQGDMGIYEQAQDFIKQAASQFGTPDILVNNAGVSYVGLLQDMSCDDWNHLLQTNLTSVFHCCKLVIPHMLQSKQGKIINISSVWGNVGASTEVAYSASKGGINALTKALAKELAPSNIQVNAVACGMIDTEMNHFLSPDELQAITDEIPTGRIGQTREVAELVYQLTQGQDYLTGQVITLDGGWI